MGGDEDIHTPSLAPSILSRHLTLDRGASHRLQVGNTPRVTPCI